MGGNDLTRRCFIGFPFDGEAFSDWLAWLQTLQGSATDTHVRWVDPADWHVTLAFLGDLDHAKQAAARQALDVAVRECAGIETSVTQPARFPDAAADVWAAELALTPPLSRLKQQLDAALAKHGLSVDSRPYRPHITVARRLTNAGGLHQLPQVMPSVTFQQIALFSSDLRSQGPRYQIEYCLRLTAQ